MAGFEELIRKLRAAVGSGLLVLLTGDELKLRDQSIADALNHHRVTVNRWKREGVPNHPYTVERLIALRDVVILFLESGAYSNPRDIAAWLEWPSEQLANGSGPRRPVAVLSEEHGPDRVKEAAEQFLEEYAGALAPAGEEVGEPAAAGPG